MAAGRYEDRLRERLCAFVDGRPTIKITPQERDALADLVKAARENGHTNASHFTDCSLCAALARLDAT